MRTRTKVFLAIFLAVLYFVLCQHFISASAPTRTHANLPKDLNMWYEGYNSEFFGDRLPKFVVIDWGEYDTDRMASTTVLSDGRFHIAFNEKYCLADRTAHLTLQHEMCHIEAFSEITRDPASEHGPRWMTCMLNLYQQGSFKPELIDGWKP